jgi:hypothetical protein
MVIARPLFGASAGLGPSENPEGWTGAPDRCPLTSEEIVRADIGSRISRDMFDGTEEKTSSSASSPARSWQRFKG